MKRIASADNQFHDGSPLTGTLGTIVTADWLNAVQEELSGAVEAFHPLDPANPGQLAAILSARRRNFIINGNFDIWQRGTALAASTMAGKYLADRFVCDSIGSTTALSQQAFALGQGSVPNEPRFFCRAVVASAAGAANCSTLGHKLESVRTLAGKTATLSFWAKADGNKNIAVELVQFFGSGGAPSASVNGIGITICAMTANWQKFIISVPVPAIAGKAIGTNDNDYLGISWWFDAGSSFNARTNNLGQQSGTFDIAQVQLEEGLVATSFEYRHPGTERLLCQRYGFALPVPYKIRVNGLISSAQSHTIRLPEMRAVPTVTNAGSLAFSLANITGTPAITPQASDSATLDFTTTSAAAAQADIINVPPFFDAEI